jgi:hypothetical protein
MTRNVKKNRDYEPGANRLLTAFTLAWTEIAPPAGNSQMVRETLAHLVVLLGRRHLNVSAGELNVMVLKMLAAPYANRMDSR